MTIMNIKTIKDKYIKKYYYWKAKRKLLSKKREDVAVFEIMEAYLAEIVIGGQEGRKKELAEMQGKIEQFSKFIKFLKKLK